MGILLTIALVVSSFMLVLGVWLGWCKGKGKSKNGWLIKSGKYRVIAIFGFNLLLDKVDSNEILYYSWNFCDFKGTPDALSSIYPIHTIKQGTTVEFFRDPTSNILRVAIVPLFGERIILKQ